MYVSHTWNIVQKLAFKPKNSHVENVDLDLKRVLRVVLKIHEALPAVTVTPWVTPWAQASCQVSPSSLSSREEETGTSASCRAPIPVSWMWNAQDAIESPCL